MSAAAQYFPAFNFSNFQTVNPDEPLPAVHVDSELQSIATSINAIIANQVLIQRSDGQIANGAVGYDQLSGALNLALNGVTMWATAKAYVTTPSPSLVNQNNQIYLCLIPHTSGTFSTDLAAGKWTLLMGNTSPVLQSFIQSTTTAAARAALGSTTVGDALFIAASATAARSTLGVGTIGNALFVAATTAAAKTAMLVANPNNATAKNLGVVINSSTTLTVTYDEMVIKTGLGADAFEDSSGSFSLNFAANGANGLDAGALTTNTFYYIYSIYNPGSNTRAVLGSLSATTPTLPSGYTYSGLIGVVRTDGSSHLLTTTQIGKEIFYQTAVSVLSNLTPLVASLTTQSISGAVPAIAKSVSGQLSLNFVASVNNALSVAAESGGIGLQVGPTIASSTITNDTSQTLNFRDTPILPSTPQTIFIAYGNTSTGTTNSLKITSFKL